MPGADLDDRLVTVWATGQPNAGRLVRAVVVFAACGEPRSVGQVAQLKVALSYARQSIWRRVLLPAPATLGDVPELFQVLFGWDGDRLHMFGMGKKRYSDRTGSWKGPGRGSAPEPRSHDGGRAARLHL